MPLRVDAATGATTLYEKDLCLPGSLPLVLARAYRSDRTADGPLGPGWHFSLDVTLEVDRDRMVFRGALGREVAFAPIQVGVQALHRETGLVVQHHPNAFVVFFSPLMQQVFPKQGATGKVLRLGRVEDRSGNAIHFGYQGDRLVRLADTAGRQIQLTYSGHRITAVHVATGEGTAPVRAFHYDGAGDLVAVRDAAGRQWRYAYQSHLMVACANRLGGTHYAQYDEARRCTALWRSDGSMVRRLAYDPPLQTTLVQATDGLQSVYRHEGPRLFGRIGPSGEAQQYLYDEQQRLVGFTDDAGDLVVAQRLDPDELTFTLLAGKKGMMTGRLDDRGLAQQVTVGLFGPFDLDYNDQGYLVGLAAPSGGSWRFERDGRGMVTQVASPEGRRVRYTRSPDGRELTAADALGTRFTGRFDALGRLTERTDALGRRERRQYDPEGRLVTVALEGGYQVRFAYDPAGHLVGVSDNEGYQAALQRDAFGRLLAQRGPEAAGGQFQYDRDGRLVAATGSGGTVRFEYELGRLAGLATQNGRHRLPLSNGAAEATSPLFGLAGELQRAGPDEAATVFTYDADGWLTAVECGAHLLAFTYDRDGLPASLQRDDGAPVALHRDQRGRLVEAVGPGHATHRFEYDAGDRLVAVQPPSGTSLAFRYDALDRLVEYREGSGTQRVAPGEVTTRPLYGPDEASPWAVLALGRHGMALVVPLEEHQVPLWFRDDALHRGTTPWLTRLADVFFRGAEAVLRQRPVRDPHQVLRAWQGDEGSRRLTTEVPVGHGGHGLNVPLDGFFLRRTYHDFFYPGWSPFALPHHHDAWDGAPDEAITGSHRTSPLKPPLPAVSRRQTLPGRPVPEDLPLLLASLT